MSTPQKSAFLRYGSAVAAVVTATAVRRALDPILGDQFPLATYFVALVFAAWYGGFGPSLMALALACLAVPAFIIRPGSTLADGNSTTLVGFGASLLFGMGISLMGGAMQAKLRRAEESDRRSRELLAAENELRERLDITLRSIGDAVVATDAEGRVVSMNPVAEGLTGWNQAEAVGKPLTEVFHLVDETSGEPAETPVSRVLREGDVVGVSDRTALIASDGTTRPVEESAAPIRDGTGSIVGVVLVFRNIAERKRAQASIVEQKALAEFGRDVGLALTDHARLSDMLHRCATATVERLDGAFARIWTLDEAGETLELKASAGMYAHLDGEHARIPVGRFKIGQIARDRKPHLTNSVIGDPLVPDQEWAAREGMVAFAGYPLVVEDRLIGVWAMFARHELSEATLRAMESVATGIAVGIERKRAEEALAESEAWLTTTLGSIGDAVIATDNRGHVRFMNRIAAGLTGWSMVEASGRPMQEIFHIVNEHTRQPAENPVERVIREGVIVGLANHTILIARGGAKETPIEDSAAPIRDDRQSIDGVVMVFRDVTEKRAAESRLRYSEARKAAILQSALDGIITIDHEGKVVEFNPAAERIFGRSRDAAIGREMSELIVPPSLRDDHRRGMARLLETGEGPILGKRIEITGLRSDGTEFPVELAVNRITSDGPPLFTGYVRDLTERRRAEGELRMWVNVFSHAGWAVAIAEPERNTVIAANPAFARMHGFEANELVGRPIAETFLPDGREDTPDEGWASRERGDHVYESVHVRKDGSRIDVLTHVSVFEDESGRPLYRAATFQDISERKRAERDARFLAEASAALAAIVDEGDALRKVAHLAVSFFADWCSVDMAAEGRSIRKVAVAHIDSAKVELAHELGRRYPQDPEAPDGAALVIRSGLTRMVSEITDDMIVQGAKDIEHLGILRELGLRSYMCVPLRGRVGTLGAISFVAAESGRVYGPDDLRLAEDLASRAAIAIENARLYGELKEADHRKNDFLATLAHELRNPLAPIRNALHLMRREESGGVMETERAMAERQVVHLARLIDDLMDIARINRGKIELQKQVVDLATVMSQAVETVRPQILERRHELTVSPPETPIRLSADPTRLEQVLWNLLNNSAKYTEPGGRIALTVETDGNMAALRVRDSGIGIRTEMLPKVFDMFVQVGDHKDHAQGGLGIGLSLVRTLVEMHGGTIAAHSDGPGTGSEFVVRLPILTASLQAEPPPVDPRRKPVEQTACRRILVVDDNVDGARSLGMLLAKLYGQDVRIAHDGPEALVSAADFLPEVILLDIGLPGMSGYEVAETLRRKPEFDSTLIVALTGWGQEDDRRRSEEAGIDRHLIKPVKPEAIVELLGEARDPRHRASPSPNHSIDLDDGTR